MSSDARESCLGEIISEGQAQLQTGPFGTMLKAEEYSSEGTPVISVGEIREGYFLGSDGIRLRVNGKSICPVDIPKVSVLPAKRWQGGHLAEVELRGHDNAFPELRYSFPLSYNPSAHCRAKSNRPYPRHPRRQDRTQPQDQRNPGGDGQGAVPVVVCGFRSCQGHGRRSPHGIASGNQRSVF